MLHYVKKVQQVPDSSSPSVSLVSVFLTVSVFFPSFLTRGGCWRIAQTSHNLTALDTESQARKMTDAPALFFESHCQ